MDRGSRHSLRTSLPLENQSRCRQPPCPRVILGIASVGQKRPGRAIWAFFPLKMVQETPAGQACKLVSLDAAELSGFNARFAQVAQSVEQRTENPRVGGSIPPLGTKYK